MQAIRQITVFCSVYTNFLAMPKRRRLPHEKSLFQRLLIIFGVILLCVAVLAGFWFLTKLGPQAVDYSKVELTVEVPEDALSSKQQSVEFEAQYEEVLVLRDAEEGDVELLKQALDAQEAYIELLPSYDPDAVARRDNLLKRYHDVLAAGLKKESLDFERRGGELEREGDLVGAKEAYNEAYQRQETINEEYSLSTSRDPSRSAQLLRKVGFMAAEPLFLESVRLEKEADELIAQEDWLDAEVALQKAMDLQDEINRKHRNSKQADVARFGRLKIKRVGILSGQDQIEIQRISRLADERRVTGENLEAASLYDEASRLQQSLNREYPESPYASTERVAEFIRKSQTAQSYELGLEIESNDERLTEFLAQGRTHEAIEVITLLRRDIKQMQETYPRSSLNSEEQQVKIRYLNLVQNEIEFIQQRINEALLPIPEEERWEMLRTEVPQGLYELLMGTNPSRNIGGAKPVDSVSWAEAKTFCRRLSWVLGKPVRLPTENEFRAALGRLRYVVLEDHVWSLSNADGVAQPVGKKKPFESGYFDLLGNVSEWLESDDRYDSESAKHIGGHAADSLEAIFTVPLRDSPRNERNRVTGFRVVVEVQK